MPIYKVIFIFMIAISFEIIAFSLKANAGSSDNGFMSGCTRMSDFLLKGRNSKINISNACKKKWKQKAYSKRVSNLPIQGQKSAGCAYAVTIFINNNFSEGTHEKKALQAAASSDDEEFFRIADAYCNEIGIEVLKFL